MEESKPLELEEALGWCHLVNAEVNWRCQTHVWVSLWHEGESVVVHAPTFRQAVNKAKMRLVGIKERDIAMHKRLYGPKTSS